MLVGFQTVLWLDWVINQSLWRKSFFHCSWYLPHTVQGSWLQSLKAVTLIDWRTLYWILVLLSQYLKLCIVSTSYLPSWMTVCRLGPWCLLEAQKYLSHWREEASKGEVGLKPPHLCKTNKFLQLWGILSLVFTGRFGQTTPPLVEFLKDILRRYPEGGQILKVSVSLRYYFTFFTDIRYI